MRHFYTFLFSFLASIPALSQELGDEAVYEYFRFLGRLNQGSVLEAAGSHGSFGSSLGFGMQADQLPEAGVELVRTDMRLESNEEKLMVPRLFLVKGLPWPVDVGLSVAILGPGQATAFAGQVQWTIFEGFQLPAFSLRLHHSKIAGLKHSGVVSTAATAAASIAFFSYLTLYGTYTTAFHQAHWGGGLAEEQDGITLAGGSDLAWHDSWVASQPALGLRWVIVPPFVSATFEQQGMNGTYTYLGKLAVGL